MKNKVTVVLLLMVIALITSACGGANDNDAAQTDDEAVEISWMTYPPFTPEYETMLKDQIAAFEDEHPNIKIDWITNDDAVQLTRQQLAAGAGPDVVYADGPMTLRRFASAGYLEPLTDQVDTYKWNDRFYDWALSTGYQDGELYGLPKSYESVVVWYNKDMFAENGWDIPTNLKELQSLNQTIQDEDIIPIAFGASDYRASNEWALTLMYNAYLGKDAMKDVISTEMKWNDDLVKEATQTWVDMWQNGDVSDKQSHAITNDDAWSLFNNGQAAMKIEGTWASNRVMGDAQNFDVGFFVMPALREGIEENIPLALGGSTGINANSEHKEEAIVFLDWLHDIEASEMEVKLGTFNPLVDLDIANVEDVAPITKDIFNEITSYMEKDQVGYASWTYWPPSANYYLWDNIEAVFIGQMSVDELLDQVQKEAEKDKEEGLLFEFE
ncbi:ABC transporter substrate-binding protein [Lentibacillus saliphilus]|uniref:ABC transporter substrate-binding protein n=1 Tax=Lentibacillus saliphilus TaxID=2737028 RepID=UPI001C2F360A|nr:ABC transporter substrate-binding protein [Lentibacillus saliphilus]